ncbi:MAG: cupredoxin domain-containing protein [Acidimicrobiia bacterium]|nr:cupredoxin domain-containing protein [Acidimicrobiia bacterium]
MRRGAVLLVVVGVVAVAAGLGARVASASDKSVSILGVNQGFSPASVTVNPGDTVTWTDRDPTPAPHNAICDESCPEPFSSGDPGATGTTGRYQFRYSGTYNYNCAVHPNMKGTVVVTGDVHPPAGTSGGGPASTAAGGAAAAGQPSATPTSAAGSGRAGSASVGSAPSASAGDSSDAAGSSVAGADAAKTPLPPVGLLTLPQPQVRVHQVSSGGTPGWVLVPAALVLVIAAAACALAWLGPRPLRLRVRT